MGMAQLGTGELKANSEWTSCDVCHKGKFFTTYISCEEDYKGRTGVCVVPQDQAQTICAKLPDCKYISTTTHGGWNKANPNMAQLGTGELKANSEWTSCTTIDVCHKGKFFTTYISCEEDYK